MGAFRFRCARALALSWLLGLIVLALPFVACARDLKDGPVVWYDDDRRPVSRPQERDPNLIWDYYNESVVRSVGRFTRPDRLARRVGGLWGADHVKMASDVNALGEVVNSTWFTNRIGIFRMALEEVARGSGAGVGPDASQPWVIVRAKTAGVTPGFTIRDARGDLYLIKFDPPGHEGMVTGAGVISQRILHAAGYFVPDDNVVYFQRDDLVLSEGVMFVDEEGVRREAVDADLDELLESVARTGDRWRAISSKFVEGVPVGPFDYWGRREDDPNDRIDHQQRRSIRGLEVFAAWLNHFDTKQHNSLDVYVGEDGRGHVVHYLIDFASTLGTGADGPARRFGWEGTVDPLGMLGRTLALGFMESDWRKLERPEGLAEVAYWESELFDPTGFEPHYPNPGFADQTHRDAYWAAKIISAFTDEQLQVICQQARYRDPRATEYVARILGERRDKIARTWFDEIAPLDFFVVEQGRLRYRDLGEERRIYPGTTARYRARVAAVDAGRKATRWSAWIESDVTEVELEVPEVATASTEEHPFVGVECQVDRGKGWSSSIKAYVGRRSGQVVAVDRK